MTPQPNKYVRELGENIIKKKRQSILNETEEIRTANKEWIERKEKKAEVA